MAELKDILDEKRKMVDQKATQYRTTRDEWNSRTKEHTTIRNELNTEVRELIQNVRQQREIREQMDLFGLITETRKTKRKSRPAWLVICMLPTPRTKIPEGNK